MRSRKHPTAAGGPGTPKHVRRRSGSHVPRRATLEGFLQHTTAEADDGMLLTRVEPLTTVRIWTQNSLYRVIVRDGPTVFIQGGRYFPQFTAAQVAGSGLGGSMLKLGWIGVGYCMEIHAAAHRHAIVTSPVRAFDIERSDPQRLPS